MIQFIFSFVVMTFILGCSKGSVAIDPYVSKCNKRSLDSYTVSWCDEYLPGSESRDVIYYFHGIDGSEKTWSTLEMRNALRGGLLKTSPHVITVSFGDRWFMSDVSFFRRSRLDVFTSDVMPIVEKELGFQPTRRVAMGESMGGYNDLRLANAETQEFDRLVALCPAIISYSPYWSAAHKGEYLAAHPFMDGNLLWKLTLFGIYEFPSPEIWNRNNPLFEIENGKWNLPTTMLSVNAQDQYGFDDGIEQFAKILIQQQSPTLLVREDGPHCSHSMDLYRQIATFVGM